MTEPHKESKAVGESGEKSGPSPEECAAFLEKKGARKAFDIDIFRAWCKSCGICAAFCPKHCIQLDEEGAPAIVDADQCSGCGWCELHCPDFAISVRPRQARRPVLEED